MSDTTLLLWPLCRSGQLSPGCEGTLSLCGISHPLHYAVTMNSQRCVLLVAGSWLATTFHALVHTLLLTRLSFCGPNVIPHFFCDLVPLLKLACSSTYVNDLVLSLVAGTLLIRPFACILTSYFSIALAVLRIDSLKGKQKAFSNCTSHLSAVSLFCGTAVGVYFFVFQHPPQWQRTESSL